MNDRFYTVEEGGINLGMPKSTSTCASELPAKIHHREPTNSSSFVFQATSAFHSHLKTRVEPQLGFYLAPL